MINMIKFAFDVLYECAPLYERIMLPIACFAFFLGGICMIKEMIRFV